MITSDRLLMECVLERQSRTTMKESLNSICNAGALRVSIFRAICAKVSLN